VIRGLGASALRSIALRSIAAARRARPSRVEIRGLGPQRVSLASRPQLAPNTAAAVPLGLRSTLVLVVASISGLMMLGWPLVAVAEPAIDGHSPQGPFLLLLLLPLVLLLLWVQLVDGGIDAKAVALLGVLTAVNAALRPLSAGTAGIELVFFLVILAGRVFGPGFGFLLGCLSLFGSALLTAGVGPWLPFQMLAAAWIGLGAGLLPARELRGRGEIALLAGYGVVGAYAFGILLNLSFWPFAISAGPGEVSGLAYIPGAPPWENLKRFLAYTAVTSSVGWDTGRAITIAVAIVLLGPLVLAVLRRAARRARFLSPRSLAASSPR
jgi:energy-coupling factor transport system substrate-specific component